MNVHEGPHGFSSNVPLQAGHVITNEPGFCKFTLDAVDLTFGMLMFSQISKDSGVSVLNLLWPLPESRQVVFLCNALSAY